MNYTIEINKEAMEVLADGRIYASLRDAAGIPAMMADLEYLLTVARLRRYQITNLQDVLVEALETGFSLPSMSLERRSAFRG